MTESDFRERYLLDEPFLKAWGAYVTDYVVSGVSSHFGDERKVATFLKTSTVPRVKSLSSLISKAFYRGYEWNDPYTEITDKVGSRFVVLLLKDIDVLRDRKSVV